MKSIEVPIGSFKCSGVYTTGPWPKVSQTEIDKLQQDLAKLCVEANNSNTNSENWYWSRLSLLKAIESIDNSKPFIYSISHTQNMVVAAIINKSALIAGIGVDCESKSRKIEKGVAVRVSKNGDHLRIKNPLEYWVAKESSFKANPQNSEKVLSDVEILSINRSKFGNYVIDFKILEVEKHFVSFAIALKGDQS